MQIKEFLAWIREQSCYCCHRKPIEVRIEPHHVASEGTSKRRYDELCIPLCGTVWGCHRKIEDKKIRIDNIIEVARMYFSLWLETKGGIEWKRKNQQAVELLSKSDLTPLERKVLMQL